MKFSWCPDLVPFECWSRKRLVEKSNTCIRIRLEVPTWLAVWIWFLSSCEPKPNFEKNEMQIWQTNHPCQIIIDLSRCETPEYSFGLNQNWRGTRIPQNNLAFKTPHDLLREFDFQLKFCTTSHSEKESDGRIEWNYMKWMYVIMDCVAGSVRSALRPCPGPGWSEDGHTLGFYNGHPIMQNIDIDLMSQACANPHRYDN